MDEDGPDGFAHVFEKVVKVTETKHKLVFKAWSPFDDVSELLEPDFVSAGQAALAVARDRQKRAAMPPPAAAPEIELEVKMEEAAESGLQTGEPAVSPNHAYGTRGGGKRPRAAAGGSSAC